MRKKSAWCLGLSLIVAAVSVIIPFREFSLSMQGVGIIGGADFPTLEFFLARFAFGGYFVLLHIALSAAFLSLITLIFPSTVKGCCKVKTSAIAAAISAAVALGLFFVLEFLSVIFLSHPDEHPIRYPVSIILGLLCLVAFILLFVFYIKERRKAPSAKGVILDVLLSLSLFFPILWLIVWIQQLIL